MAPGQLRIVPEPAGVGRLPTDLQPAGEVQAATGRRAGEDVEAGVAQGSVAPLSLLLLLLLAVVVVPLLLRLDDVSLLLLLLGVMVVMSLALGQTVGGERKDDGSAGKECDKGAETGHFGVTSQVANGDSKALPVTRHAHHTRVTTITLKRASYGSSGRARVSPSWLTSALVGAVIGSKQMKDWPSGAQTWASG